MWKENILEDLEAEKVECKSAGKFLVGLKRIWRRRRRDSKSGRIKEVGAERKNNGGIYAGVQMGSKRKQICVMNLGP